MRSLLILSFTIIPFLSNAQTVGIALARTYANSVIIKTYGRENVKEINIEIIEWDYNINTDRLYVYYKATYKSWEILYWHNSDHKIQLKCNLNGSAAEMKFDGAFENWQNLGNLRE